MIRIKENKSCLEFKKDNFHNQDIGKFGEEKACSFLKNQGYWILCTNFTTNQGEIDIIARDKDEYVFIEVKTRMSKKFGNPVEAVNKEKMKHILRTSKFYIYVNKLENKCIRYDIVEVYIGEKNLFINHIKNVFF